MAPRITWQTVVELVESRGWEIAMTEEEWRAKPGEPNQRKIDYRMPGLDTIYTLGYYTMKNGGGNSNRQAITYEITKKTVKDRGWSIITSEKKWNKMSETNREKIIEYTIDEDDDQQIYKNTYRTIAEGRGAINQFVTYASTVNLLEKQGFSIAMTEDEWNDQKGYNCDKRIYYTKSDSEDILYANYRTLKDGGGHTGILPITYNSTKELCEKLGYRIRTSKEQWNKQSCENTQKTIKYLNSKNEKCKERYIILKQEREFRIKLQNVDPVTWFYENVKRFVENENCSLIISKEEYESDDTPLQEKLISYFAVCNHVCVIKVIDFILKTKYRTCNSCNHDDFNRLCTYESINLYLKARACKLITSKGEFDNQVNIINDHKSLEIICPCDHIHISSFSEVKRRKYLLCVPCVQNMLEKLIDK